MCEHVLPVFFNECRGNTSGCEAEIYFPCATNVQTACEAGNRARNREFASERVANELRRQQSVQREFASGRVARLSGLIVRKKTIGTI